MTHDEAVVECNKLKRPLASIRTRDQQNKATKVIQSREKNVWISAIYDKANRAYKWEDGSYLSYRNWEHTIPQNFKAFREHNCVSVSGGNGKWHTQICSKKFMALCGPKEDKEPLLFTPFYPVDGYKCVYELKEKLRRLKQKDYVCDKPHMVECSAKTKNGKTWVTYDKQESDTLKCSEHEISCKSGKELNCSTLRVRFLCPQEENQCTELQKLQAPACSGGQLNGKNITDQVSVKEDAYKAVTKQSYFSLVVYALDMKVILNGNHLRVRIADKFRGKLCGLCGDCGTDKFKLRNGTIVALPLADGKAYKKNDFKPIGVDWMVQSDEFKNKKYVN
ncbi:C-type mannose receptor 2 [Plakobranchus ocellatus]|uniref:C-type mannose receptor 2 n=1 Tax=Plakobranchus ocellatus TaxID=259542 RepID=A0AAV4D4N9_9GAST|nr:C-type mannose receptor 2 [Plakobranchus ocellatus]